MKRMATFSEVYIIYNPNSTGDSKAMAEDLRAQLNLPGVNVTLRPTKYAGHAREIARRIAQTKAQPLIVSSSGDGGYHEVINGVVDSGNTKATCAVLAAGNANDHSRTLQEQPLSKQIAKGHIVRLDLIEVTITNAQGQSTTEYAHSYVGLGLTPVVAAELNKQSLNALKELRIVVSTFMKYRPFKIKRNGKVLKLDSLLFANINKMAKLLTLAPYNKPRDGKFEVIYFPAGHKLRLIKYLTKAVVSQLDAPRRASKYEFRTLKKMPMQLDGEVTVVEAHSRVLVKAAPKKLRTVI